MKIQIKTDKNIEGHERLYSHVEEIVTGELSRFREQITRVEIHLSDENSHKNGPDDKRCVMEARLEGRKPEAVTHQAESLDQAVRGAAGKLERVIESTLGRLRER